MLSSLPIYEAPIMTAHNNNLFYPPYTCIPRRPKKGRNRSSRNSSDANHVKNKPINSPINCPLNSPQSEKKEKINSNISSNSKIDNKNNNYSEEEGSPKKYANLMFMRSPSPTSIPDPQKLRWYKFFGAVVPIDV